MGMLTMMRLAPDSRIERGRSSYSPSGVVAALLLLTFLVAPHGETRAGLVSHWKLDGDLSDSGPAGNQGLFVGEAEAVFAPAYAPSLGEAVQLDGVDDVIDVEEFDGLPIHQNLAYTVTLWVRGDLQAGAAVYAESSQSGAALFTIATDQTGATGRVEILVRDQDENVLVDRQLSEGVAFDGEWHHIAWVDDGGEAALYIDGIRDAEDFSYTRTKSFLDQTSVGAVVGKSPCCHFGGRIDDVRVFDHPLSEDEILNLLHTDSCPGAGDTHAGELVFEAPPGGDVEGTYLAIATGAVDESGDDILYLFRAESAKGEVLTAGPQDENIAEFTLGVGTWTLSVTVDDDLFCQDLAADATFVAPPFTVGCPTEGDTHCGDLLISGPFPSPEGHGPLYFVEVLGATDDSGDEILYTFTAESDQGRFLRLGPQTENFIEVNLSEGRWSFEVTVDDDVDCPDAAKDAVCREVVVVGCPEDGDTHCDGLVIDAPDGLVPGVYTVTVFSATDESGDPIRYSFFAQSTDGRIVQAGPLELRSANLILGVGTWTITVTVDDDPFCSDQAPDAVCTDSVTVSSGPPELISHWTLDGGLEDVGPSANHGAYLGESQLTFVPGFDGEREGALFLGEEDGCVDVLQNRSLPLYLHPAFTVAMWVKGAPQSAGVVWSESSRPSTSSDSLFRIGTEENGATGQVTVSLSAAGGQTILAHRLSQRDAFDGEWHHIAWVDDRGKAALYIDGIRDPSDFSYRRPPMTLDRTAIGCMLIAEQSDRFRGTIDDVRVYNYALPLEEVLELLPESDGCPDVGDTHCEELAVQPPAAGGEGVYTASLLGGSDDSGDAIIYTFTAENEQGRFLQVGPQGDGVAEFPLFPGIWTITGAVDDDLGCRDVAADARCEQVITVERGPMFLVSHWKLDGNLEDAEAANDGMFSDENGPVFVEDRFGAPVSALQLDGIDDYVRINSQQALPLYAGREYSVAMWVKGGVQEGKAVWSESSSTLEGPVFSIGTDSRATTGQVEINLYDENGMAVLAHGKTEGIAFDDTWHHVAWVDVRGDTAIYIDGVRDPTDFRYERSDLPVDTSTIGGIVRDMPCCGFEGTLDDVRVYNFGLTADEVRELARDGPDREVFHRGDPNDDGNVDITDGIYILSFLFLGGPDPTCREAADADDSGAVNITDPVYVLNFLFQGGPPPLEPGPASKDCGPDPMGSVDLGCESYTHCAGG